VLGREAEIDRTRRSKASRELPVFYRPRGRRQNERGAGPAQRIADGRDGSPDDRILIEIDAASLLAGTGVRGALASGWRK
jgi:hypothetical protein